ncbi:MAG: hypothetical protein Q9161_004241 [Pseudevernia consocians]
MPSIQKIVLALAFAASTYAAQISDGQIQQPTSTFTPVVAPVKQITDGQIQQVSSTPVAVVTPAVVKQITDGQIQQVSSTPAAVVTPAVVKQITDGQLQQVTSTPVVTPAVVKQITDGQIQQVASASVKPTVSANATSITTPSVTAATFHGAAPLFSYSMELVTVAIGAAAVLAML